MVLKSTGLVGLLLVMVAVAVSAGMEPQSLISQLGSPKYADREAASVALERLGQTAFPLLKAARSDRDPEVRNRAEVLLDTIERSLLTEPARVRIDAGRHTATEVVEKLVKLENTPLQLVNFRGGGNSPRFLEAAKPETLGFWAILDRLGLIPLWDVEADFGRPAMRRAVTVKLVPRSGPQFPISDHGPFRLTARDVVFGADAPPPEIGIRFPGGMPAPTARRAARNAEFLVSLEMMAEPRLSLKSSGPIRILEAVDDRGQTLVAEAHGDPDVNQAFNGDRTVSALSLQLNLRVPERPGKTLKRLRGLVPIEVESRKREPTIIPLSPPSLADRRPIMCGGATILVHGLTMPDQNFGRGYVLEITVRRDEWALLGMNNRMGNRRRLWGEVTSSDSERFWQNMEIVDAQGQPYRAWSPTPVGVDPDGVRILLNLPAREEGSSPPSEIRFYGQIRTSVEVPFTFTDLKLP